MIVLHEGRGDAKGIKCRNRINLGEPTAGITEAFRTNKLNGDDISHSMG
jgi:hypothetical protein